MNIGQLDKGSRDFFTELCDMVKPFRSRHSIPEANWSGCRLARGTGKDKGKIRFGFMAKGGNLITVDIVARDIMADPKQYIDNMLEAINQGLKQMDDNVKIIVAQPNSLSQAINAQNRRIH